jgi:antitoxin PrlF
MLGPLIREISLSAPKPRPNAVYSKVSVKSQTVLPHEVRERLQISPGDQLRYVFERGGVRIEKVTRSDDDPFATFTEWASAEDDEAYGNL